MSVFLWDISNVYLMNTYNCVTLIVDFQPIVDLHTAHKVSYHNFCYHLRRIIAIQ